MAAIFSKDDEIADIPLSVKQLAALEQGEEIAVIYTTPQLLRGTLGQQSGSFSLQKDHDRIVTQMPDAVKAYAKLQKSIAAIRDSSNGG
jgi:hypothetical protein